MLGDDQLHAARAIAQHLARAPGAGRHRRRQRVNAQGPSSLLRRVVVDGHPSRPGDRCVPSRPLWPLCPPNSGLPLWHHRHPGAARSTRSRRRLCSTSQPDGGLPAVGGCSVQADAPTRQSVPSTPRLSSQQVSHVVSLPATAFSIVPFAQSTPAERFGSA